MAESMWVSTVRTVGLLQIGRLLNTPFGLPFNHSDWVVFGSIGEEHKPIALLVLDKEVELQQVTAAAKQHTKRFMQSLAKERARTEDELSCKCCGKKNAYSDGEVDWPVWMVTAEAWKHVPAKYRKEVLCKKCFRDLTGLDPKEHDAVPGIRARLGR
jgi:hypothetical protein